MERERSSRCSCTQQMMANGNAETPSGLTLSVAGAWALGPTSVAFKKHKQEAISEVTQPGLPGTGTDLDASIGGSTV